MRVVGHTMRLLLRAGRIKEAKELDERFFGRGVVVVVGGQEGEGEGVDGKRKEKLGFGLGLDRGGIGVAWMQSIVVRLEEGQGGEFEGERAKEFGELLKEMREKEGGRVMSPLMLAFVVRRLEIIHERLRGAGKEKKGARRQIRGILKEIKGADEGGEELVSLALLDGAVEKLERQVEGEEVDMELFGEVERKIEGLVGTLEPDQLEEDLGVLTELHQRVPDAKSIDRHSHILYLAIRFLLLRARQQQTSTSSSQLISKDTLSSASQLYTLMLDLTPSVSRSILDLVQLRQRQSSALYRLLWAHLGFFDTPSTSSSSPSERLSDPPSTPDHELIASAYELIDLTLSSTSTLPPLFLPETTHLPSHISHDPLLVGVSTKFHRQALYLLSLPSSPSRRDQNLPSPPWSMFQHAFSLILAQRLHDSKRLKHDTRKPSKIPDWNLPLIVQPAFAIHLLRATLLSHSPNGTPLTRLGELVEFIEKLEQGGQERKARRLMWKAVGVVVEGEWKGEGAREWKELIKGKLRSWVREKEKESVRFFS